MCVNMIFVCTVRYMTNGGPFVYGYLLIHLAINIQGCVGVIHKIRVVLHSLEWSVSSISQLAITIICKDHGLK